MNMFAKFDENPAMTLQDIKETKCYRQRDAHTDNVKTVYPSYIIIYEIYEYCREL